VSGSSVHAQSEAVIDMDDPSVVQTYMWWTVHTAVSGENFHIEISSDGTQTVGVDQVSISVIRLTPDLAENTDWKYNENVPGTPTSMSTNDTDTTTNNATITLAPASANHRWLILSKARYGPGIDPGTSVQSRISRSGEASNDLPQIQLEGEDAVLSVTILCGATVHTLAAQSNTYTEISKSVGTPSFAAVNRISSGIFMLDLDMFKNVVANNEDSPQEEPNSTTTAHGVLVHTTSLTPTQLGDVFVMGFCTMDSGSALNTWTMRLQVDNTDHPAGQTADAYQYSQWTSEDRLPWAMHEIIQDMSAASHTADIDGSVSVTGTSRGTYSRLLVMFTLELASATGITQIKPETEAITESVVTTLGSALKQVKNETEAITESVIPIVTSAANLIQDADIVFRMSGGSTNTSLAASIGGAKSTQAGGVITNKLFDDVSPTEASTGDTEYRCFYVVNNHSTLTARDVKIWIPVNTPAQDEIDIAIGESAVNSTEQGPLTNENTAPGLGVTFVVANSEASAINLGILPAGQHRAVWLRRIVPINTNFYPNNTYSIQLSLTSDHTADAGQNFDSNGIQYPQPLLAEGYKLTYSNDTTTFVENFQVGGSMRCNFRDSVRDSALVGGYIKVDDATTPDGEEVSGQMNGGQHPSAEPPAIPNNTYADTMDIGITNMLGTASRVRFEPTHPTYTGEFQETYSELPIGQIRDVWRGYLGLKVNLDTNNDGTNDSVALIGMVDIGGLDSQNKPVNNWKVTYKRIFTAAEITATGIKSVFTPYVATIGQSAYVETTMRVDGQVYADWTNANQSLRPYKYMTCKAITASRL